MSDQLSVKLPQGIINLHLPALQTTGALTSLTGSTRITEQSNTRVTRGGNTRVTRSYAITSYPELTVLKLPNGVVSIFLQEGKNITGKERATAKGRS